MKLLQFPHGTAWRAWRANTIHAVIAAAGRQDYLAQEWILKVETHDLSELEEPGDGWISLDRKLAAAPTTIAHGEIGRQITRATTIALISNMVARGRVLLALVFRYYASGNNAQVLYELNRSHNFGSHHPESFRNAWNMVLSELSEPPDPKV